MKHFKRYWLPVLLTTCIAGLPSYSSPHQQKSFCNGLAQKNYNLLIHFKAVAGEQPLVFGKTYTNAFNEPYTAEKFKFYICRINLTDNNTHKISRVNMDDYFLVDFSDSSSLTIPLSVVPGQYSIITFLLGVDSIHNVSGAQTGALDPARGMFWTWNSGYVMAKLEGSSPLSNQPGHAITYHIGGYKDSNNVAKNIALSFSHGQQLEVYPGKISGIIITANVNAWFTHPHDIRIKEIPTCTTPGSLAKNISENYANMFTVTALTNE